MRLPQDELERTIKRGVVKGALLAWIVIVLVTAAIALMAWGFECVRVAGD